VVWHITTNARLKAGLTKAFFVFQAVYPALTRTYATGL
jgi:hypothetical protein